MPSSLAASPTSPWLGAPPPPRREASRRPRLPVRRVRRIVAAALLALAVLLAVRALTPAPPTTVTVATRDLPAGHVLRADDLTFAPAHPASVPDGAIDIATAVGHPLGRSVRAREPVTSAALSPAHDIADDERAVHAPVADPGALRSIRPGDRVDLIDNATGRVTASGVRVISVDDLGDDTSGHGLLLAVPAAAVGHLVPAVAASGAGVTPALRRP